MPFDFKSAFNMAQPYKKFLQTHGNLEKQHRWQNVYDAVSLTSEQTALLAGFRRKMHVLCMAGVWCGDCVNACPIFQRFAEASNAIDLRFVNREQTFNPNAGDQATALADAVAARIFAATPRPETIKPLLEEMLQQLRHLNRHNNMTDFSLSLLLATVCQMVVLAFLALGAWDAFRAAGMAAANMGNSWWFYRVGEQLKSLEWFLAAIVVQGIVIAFHLHKRNT